MQAGQTVLDVLLEGKLVASKSEGRRMIDQNGVRLDGETLNDGGQPFPHPGVLQVGKRRFLRVSIRCNRKNGMVNGLQPVDHPIFCF